MTSASRVVRGLGALAILVGVVVGTPALLVVLGLIPDGLPTAGDVVATLGARDDGQLLRGVLAAGAWVCWFVFTVATIAELWAVVTVRPVPRLPGLRAVQGPVAALVAAVVLGLSFSATAAAPLATAAPSDRPPLPVAAVAGMPASSTTPALDATASAPLAQSVESQQRYVVQRRDTLWALAGRHLGDPLRYPEIVALNGDVVGPDNRITVGTVLVFPRDAVGVAAEADPATADTDVVVESGDSLWSITQTVTGDGAGWPVVWQANEGRLEPGGGVLDDPDLIRAGWTITVPAAGEAPAPSAVPDSPPAPQTTPSSPATQSPTPSSTTPSSTTPNPAPTTSAQVAPPRADAAPSPIDVAEPQRADPSADDQGPVIGIAAGVISSLAAGSLVALQRYRRRQFRHRRPGHLLPAVPEHLGAAERMLTTRAGVDVEWLDQALRSIVSGSSTLPTPDVVAVSLASDTITVVLAEPAMQAPPLWTADPAGMRWMTRRTSDERRGDIPLAAGHAPFPCLVAIGSTRAGEQWFIDLERVGVLSIAGDEGRGIDLLRYLAAEFAHNRWSEMSMVDAVGLGDELATLNPDRLLLHDSAEPVVTRFSERLGERVDGLRAQSSDALRARVEDLQSDAWAPRILLLGPDQEQPAAQLARELGQVSRRIGMALVVLGDAHGVGSRVVVDSTGALIVPDLGLTLVAHQLPTHEAAPLAQLLAHAAVIPEQALDGDGDASCEDGMPHPEVDGTDHPADTRLLAVDELVDSVLPLPDGAYVRAAATTVRDVHELAPAATDGGRRRAVDSDPYLDRDLADWHDPACSRPKLTLLGPVRVEAKGRLPERNPRRQFYTEVVAFLATRLDGATSEQYATALWPDEPDVIGKTKVRQSISVVRTWLGTDESGEDYLPSGLTAAAGGRYRINGGIVDADLFRRLRARGVGRGADGIADLQSALDLVSGRPFELPDLRVRGVGGYGWLLDDGSRMDLELAAVIVDVAHLVATHHLGNGQPERAAAAAQVALRSGTYEDVPLLDLVAACDALGNRAEADAYLSRILANHDADVEEDLPPRTAEVLFRRDRP